MIVSILFKCKLTNFSLTCATYILFVVVYTVEFQKRGLPHAHILLFFHPEDKHKSGTDIDKIIIAEIPDKEAYPKLYDAVKNYMMHGPCSKARPNSPCMNDGKCSKYFPKKFSEETTFDEDGYPLYRRRDDKRTIEIGGTPLDNRYVVPYNPELLLRYEAHINVVWCNQNRAIKYLFKYINKGNDRITTTFYQSDNNGENA